MSSPQQQEQLLNEMRGSPGPADQILNVPANNNARNMRGRIYAANDVLNGVGGNEQLANALAVKSPTYGNVNFSPKPINPKMDAYSRGGNHIKSTYGVTEPDAEYDPWMRNEQRYREKQSLALNKQNMVYHKHMSDVA